MDRRDAVIIHDPQPAVIDAFSASNQELDERAVGAILHAAGLNADDGVGADRLLARGRHPPMLSHASRSAVLGDELRPRAHAESEKALFITLRVMNS
ncbi:MAG: hypothetical protein ABSG43_29570 [Solirubrobacteraceae bacterium]|jgi:hypothetical protein